MGGRPDIEPNRVATAVLQEFARAQHHAARLAQQPAPAWRSRTSHGGPIRLAGLAAVGLAVGGGLGWAWVAGSTPPLAQAAARPGAEPLASPSSQQPASEPSAEVAPPPPPVGVLSVTRRDTVIRIDATDAPIGQVIEALAATTQSRVRGGDRVAASPVRRSLHWQGTSTAAAWDALLGGVVNAAVSCGAGGCDVWIVGQQAALPAPQAGHASAEPAGPAPTHVAPSTPPTQSEESESN